MDSRVAKLLRVGVPILGQAENDFRELEPGCLYGLWTAADTWSDPLPRIVECRPERLQLLGAVRGILE